MTIDELLKSLQKPGAEVKLSNTRETWSRIGQRDAFAELGLGPSELQKALSDFTKENEYSNI